MGSIFEAKCNCGYESDQLFLGGGMADFGERLEVPYYCDNCKHVGSLNLFKRISLNDMGGGAEPEPKKRITCKKCRRKVQHYGNLESGFTLQTKKDDTLAFEWGDVFSDVGKYYLSATEQYCPKCEKYTLRFYDVGCWD